MTAPDFVVPSGVTRFLTFRAGGRRFAVPLDRVRGAVRPKRIAALPGAPPFYAGLALVKGEALGVIDARRALVEDGAQEPEKAGVRSVLLLFEGESRALLVEKVEGIEEIAPSCLSAPPPSARHVSGLREYEGRFLSVVDVDSLLGGRG